MEHVKKNGYDLARHVLYHEHGGVQALLDLARKDESCWLEMKAGMELTPEDKKKGQKPADLYWNIAEAAIAMMNTSGGVLLIGVQDKTHAVVPLRENDPRHVIERNGMEDYRRMEILERIWPDKKEWKTSGMIISIDPAPEPGLIEVVDCKYQGETIAAVLIKPASQCLRCIKRVNNLEQEYIPARELGAVGKVREYKRSGEMAAYESTREIETAFLGELYARFERETRESSEAGLLDRKIREYYEKFAESVRRKRHFELSCFTPLDGSGDLESEEMDDFMSPEAEEFFDPLEDDEWIDPECDGKSKKAEAKPVPDDDDEDDEDEVDGEDDEGEEDDDSEDSYRVHRSGDLITLMQEIPRMLVLGEPGGGKTTTLIHFTLGFRPVEDIPGEPSVLAVYIPMGQWIKGGSIEQLLNKSTGLSPEQWTTLIRQNRLRLVIDAFNECPDMFQEAALLNIRHFLLAHSDLPAVISSRTAPNLKDLHLSMFTVEPMDREHQKKYLTRYLNDEAAADDLLDRLSAMSGGTVLAANPMLLRLIVEVFRDSHELPPGRAGLYHQWLKQWYTREFGKAEKTGSPLPWDFDTALDILSELSLQGRFRGYRDIPLDFASEILQDRGPECIDKLCQGPVVMIEDDFIRFRHETFQEYLCAEKLVQEPDLVEQIPQADAAQWTMVLAYAAELQWPLPDPLWRFAWKVEPWLGIALTDDRRASSINMTEKTIQKKIYYHALRGTWSIDLPPEVLWSGDTKYPDSIRKVLNYILSTNEDIYTRWLNFELWQLCRSSRKVGSFTSFCQSSIALKISLQTKNETLKQFLERCLLDPRISDDLRTCLQTIPSRIDDILLERIDLATACRMVQSGLIRKDVFADKVPDWITSSTIKTAKRLIACGLAGKEDFTDKILEWASTPDIAKQLIECELATREDFADKVPDWIIAATPGMARPLIECGFATKEDFANKITRWMVPATPKTAKKLIKYELATKEDFADKILEWATTPGMAKQLIECGLATKEDFANKVPKWIVSATPQTAKPLIKLGVATKKDFADKIPEWIASATPQTAKCLISVGLAVKEDFADKVSEWIASATAQTVKWYKISDWAKLPKTAKLLIKLGLAAEEDFVKKESTETQQGHEYSRSENDEGAVMDQKYHSNQIVDERTAQQIRRELAGKKWQAIVRKATVFFSFFESEAFSENIFCSNSFVMGGQQPEVGSIWEVEVTVRPDKKKKCYGFAVSRAKFLSPPRDDGVQNASCVKTPVISDPTTTGGNASVDSLSLFENKSVMIYTYKILNKLCGVKTLQSPTLFAKLLPSDWNFDIQFCRERKETFGKITALLQSLSTKNNNLNSEKCVKKKKELAALLDSEPEFQRIKKYPVASDLEKKPAPKPAAPAVQQKPSSVPQKAKQPVRKAKIKTVKGREYDPGIEFENGMSAIGGVTDFSRDANHIRIYIDETWPNTLDPDYDNVGVISGIVWLGAAPDYEILPAVATHLRENYSPKEFREAISNLLNCSSTVFPFVFPIFKRHVEESDYPELLRIALITLLGWILPQKGRECEVEIFCEGIGTSQMKPGKNCADQFKEIRNAVGLTAGRMQRWKISKFISMRTADKEYEYIPYADAVGYLTVPTQKARKWGDQFHVEDWPGYVPLSLDLLRRLTNLDTGSPAGYADELFEFAKVYQHTKLFSYVLVQAFSRAKADPDFKAALFEKLEKMFEAKERDLPLLNYICRELEKEFPLEEFRGQPRQKLIRILVELQKANHAGDPENAEKCIALYKKDHEVLFDQDPGLCAYMDMNLTVHYYDRFEFRKAAEICYPWKDHEAFRFLSPENRGRILSSIGQIGSLCGNYPAADMFYRRALEIFRDPANPLPDQVDQTSVYRAMNALDAAVNFKEAAELAERVFGCSFAEAIAKYAGNTDKPFHHHLLVKNLYFNPEVVSLRDAYLQTAPKWTGRIQHPWELIELYRALLLHKAGRSAECQARFIALQDLYAELGSGAIMQLLNGFALTVWSLVGEGFTDELRIKRDSLLDQAERALPATSPICQKLREAKQLNPDFWAILPFNYK